MDTLSDAVANLKDTMPKISVDEAIDALTLTGNHSADLRRIVEYAFEIIGKLHRNIAAQWTAVEIIAARVDAQSA
jgi:hypothetical protein